MKVIDARLVGCLPGKNRIRVTWEYKHGFLLRLLFGFPRTSVGAAMYEGTGRVWRLVGDHNLLVSKLLRAELEYIEMRLLNPEP